MSTDDAPPASNERDTPTCKSAIAPSRCATWRCTASIQACRYRTCDHCGYVWGTRDSDGLPTERAYDQIPKYLGSWHSCTSK